MREDGCMEADSHPIALTAELRALSYLSHPMAAFGNKRSVIGACERIQLTCPANPLVADDIAWHMVILSGRIKIQMSIKGKLV